MKEYTFISFTADPPPRAVLRKMLADLDISTRNSDLEILDTHFYVRMLTSDPRLDKLIAALNQLSFDPPWWYRREIDYDRRDLEAAEFLVAWITRPERGDTGPVLATEYDLSTGCPACGTGATQVSPLRISASALPKKGQVSQTYSHEALISETLATELRIDLRGERGLRQVEDRRTRERLPWWQILPDTYMPRLAPESRGLIGSGHCPICRRDGFGHDLANPFEPVYNIPATVRSRLPDFVFTYEHFGVSRLRWEPGKAIGLAYPATIVSNRAMRVFLKNKVRGIRFIPIRFLD